MIPASGMATPPQTGGTWRLGAENALWGGAGGGGLVDCGQDQAGVDPPEPERVGDAHARPELAAVQGRVVEVARLVRRLQVEGRRDPSPFHGQAADRGL